MSPNNVSGDLPPIAVPDPQQLAEQVCTILSDQNLSTTEKINSLLQLTVGLVGGVAAVFYRQEGSGLQSGGQLLSPQAASLSRDILAEMHKGAKESIKLKKANITPLAMASHAHIFSCSLFSVKDDVPCSLSVLILPEKKAPEPFLVVLQLMTTVLDQVRNSSVHPPGHLLRTLASSTRVIDSFRSLSDAIREATGCDLIAIGRSSGGTKVRLEHVSDVVKVDVRTDQARRYLKVMQEVGSRRKLSVWPSIASETDFEESLLLKELVQANGMRQGAAVPLSAGGEFAGVVVLLWLTAIDSMAEIREVQETAVLSGLFVRDFGKKSGGGSLSAVQQKNPQKSKIIVGLLFLALCALAVFPKEFTLHPATIVKPIQVRYVVAGFDGLLQKVYVEPGDRVKEESALALLDGRELELELRSVRADGAKSLKMRDNHMAVGKVAEAQIAFLEYQRLQERELLLLGRQRQLSLTSPFDGIILSGDLKQSEGGPVAKGEVLFEVAPLERVLLQLLVADEDISYVKQGAKVDVHFDAFAGALWQGAVSRIAPQSELVQGENVFPVSIEVANRDGLLLPGMQGYASIDCGKKSVLWIYFHKPWYALRRLLAALF